MKSFYQSFLPLKFVVTIFCLLLASVASAEESSVQVNGVIESVLLSKQMVKVKHDPVPEWEWPGMKMKFAVSPDIDLRQLEKGQTVEMTLQKDDDGKVIITQFK